MSIGPDPALLDKNFILTNDIIFDPNNNPAHVFTKALIAPDLDNSIFDFQGTTFTGILDGRNHAVSNIKFVCNPNNRYIGVIGYMQMMGTNSGVVKNISFTNPSVIGEFNYYTGLIVGYLEQGAIINCVVLNGFYHNGKGGTLAGDNFGTIRQCRVEATVEGDMFTGGIVGGNGGVITNSSFIGQITGNEHVGGIAGANGGTISNCFAICEILDTGAAKGGIAGDNSGLISNCYSEGSVNGYSTLGGIVGFNSIGYGGTVSSSFSTCHVSGTADLGGIVGKVANGTVNDSYFLASLATDNGSGVPLDDPNMMIQANFVNWDFMGEDIDGNNEIWRMCVDGVDYPRLSWEFAQNGDFVCSDGIDLSDLQALALNWLTLESDNPLLFNYACDANGDEKINLEDYAVLSRNWLSGI
jgi:hypothetical protein